MDYSKAHVKFRCVNPLTLPDPIGSCANSPDPDKTVSGDIHGRRYIWTEASCINHFIPATSTDTSANRAAPYITKTRLYNFDPLKPHFYIVKLGFTGVYIILLILLKNIDCGYSLEPHQRGGSNEYPQSMFWAGIWKISAFFIWKFFLLWL